MHPVELQTRLMPYKGTFDDFNDRCRMYQQLYQFIFLNNCLKLAASCFVGRVIQFGYLVLFSPAFPLAPLLAFVNNVVEIRTASYKMCRGFQRPQAKSRSGIGSWFVVLTVLGFLAVITNAAMVAFVGSQEVNATAMHRPCEG